MITVLDSMTQQSEGGTLKNLMLNWYLELVLMLIVTMILLTFLNRQGNGRDGFTDILYEKL